MATVVNDRDVLLQAAGQRYTASSASALLIAASAPAFTVDVGGTPTPSSITFNAVRLNVSGTATFSTSDGSTLTVNGDTATLAYANMPSGSNSTTVTVTVNDGGTVYSRSTTIAKVRDGQSGTGTTGQRGAGTYYASGGAWSDTAAHLATPGETVVDDQVIIWNGSSFAEARRWSGSAWVASGAHIPGDVIVGGTIIGNKIKAGTLELFAADGVTPIITLGGGLRPGFEAPGTKNSDIVAGDFINRDPNFADASAWTVPINNSGAAPRLPFTTNVTGAIAPTCAYSSNQKGTAAADVWLQDAKMYPISRDRLYELVAELHSDSGNGRIAYLGICFYNSAGDYIDGVATGWPSNGNWSGYVWAGSPAEGRFSHYGGTFGNGTSNPIPSGATQCRIGVILNYGTGGSGANMAAQGLQIRDITEVVNAKNAASAAAQAAAEAKAAADSALGSLNNVFADGILSRDEKQQAIQDWNTIYNEANGIYYQANDLGLVTVRDEYWSALTELQNYLPYGWDNTGVDTAIDRSVWNSKFTTYKLKRQAVADAVAAELRLRAAQAKNAADAANNGLADKLSRTAGQVMTGYIALQTGGGVVAGSMSWDANGLRTGGSGVAMTPYGIVAHNGTKYTFVLEAANGNATFAGELSAAHGTFGSLRIAAGGYIAQGAHTGAWAYPAAGNTGWTLHPNGLLFGDYYGGKYVEIHYTGNMYAPGFKLESGQITLTNTIIIDPQINSLGGATLTLSSSPSTMYFTYTRNIVNGNAGTITANASGTGLTYAWAIEGNMGNRVLYSINGYSSSNLQLSVNGGGAIGMFDWTVTCTVTDSKGLSVTKTMIVTVELT